MKKEKIIFTFLIIIIILAISSSIFIINNFNNKNKTIDFTKKNNALKILQEETLLQNNNFVAPNLKSYTKDFNEIENVNAWLKTNPIEINSIIYYIKNKYKKDNIEYIELYIDNITNNNYSIEFENRIYYTDKELRKEIEGLKPSPSYNYNIIGETLAVKPKSNTTILIQNNTNNPKTRIYIKAPSIKENFLIIDFQ